MTYKSRCYTGINCQSITSISSIFDIILWKKIPLVEKFEDASVWDLSFDIKIEKDTRKRFYGNLNASLHIMFSKFHKTTA